MGCAGSSMAQLDEAQSTAWTFELLKEAATLDIYIYIYIYIYVYLAMIVKLKKFEYKNNVLNQLIVIE